MIVEVRLGGPGFVEVKIDEYRNKDLKLYTIQEANRLLTRASVVDKVEDRPSGSYLDLPNTKGVFASGPDVMFEYKGVQKSFSFGKIPYEKIIDDHMALMGLGEVFSKRIKAVRSWTDQQIEVRCERVSLDKFGKFDDESRKLFVEGDGKLQVLVQYILTNGPKKIPNVEIFINGILCENRRNHPPKDLRESTEYIVAKGAYGEVTVPIDHLSIFTPRSSPIYHYGTWKSAIQIFGGEIDYSGDQRKIEIALNERIKYFRAQVTNLIKVNVSIARRRI